MHLGRHQSRTLLGICPHDWVRPGSKCGSEASRNRSGFCPPKEQIDDATKFAIGVVLPVLSKFPVASPAKADEALTSVAAAMQAMTVIRDLVTNELSPSYCIVNRRSNLSGLR